LPTSTDIHSAPNKTIRLEVGNTDEPTILNIHQDVLCRTSKFFKSSLKTEWTSMKEEPNKLDLSDDTPDVVHLYIKWLYTGALPLTLHHRAAKEPCETTAAEAEKVFVVLAQAYVFGLDSAYQNAVVKTFHTAKIASSWNPGPECVDIVFTALPVGSWLRRFIVHSIAWEAFDDGPEAVGWAKYIERYPQEALAEAMKED
jgi:hypothetical protein